MGGQNTCCNRDKQNISTDSNLKSQPNIKKPEYFSVLEKLTDFNPKRNSLSVQFVHYMQEGCQGLMRSLPKLIQIAQLKADKGEHFYYNPKYLKEYFNLKENVSPGIKFEKLSEAFKQELNHFYTNKIILEKQDNWGVIMILKLGKYKQFFSIKKRNGWEYVIHTLYEVLPEEIKQEEEQIKEKLKEKSQLQSISETFNSESSTFQDENILNEIQQNPISTNVEQKQTDIQRNSTKSTFKQHSPLRLRDMVFKGFNCGEICFSPFDIFLNYLDSIIADYEDTQNKFLQLMTFTDTTNNFQ